MKEQLDNLTGQLKSSLDGSSSPFSPEFYRKHLGKAFLLMFLMYIFIMMRYTHEELISEIGTLKTELADVRYTSIATFGELTSKNKPEIVKSKISESTSLVAADEPPIEVE